VKATVFITGGGGDIGAAAGAVLAAAGHPVVLADVDLSMAQQHASQIVEAGGRALGLVADVTDPDSLETALDAGVAELGPLGHVVAAAGVISTTPFLEVDAAVWRRTIEINLTGTFLTLQASGRRLVANGGGSIVAISSVAGRGGRADAADYAASKAGVISLTRSAALALAPSNVRVNAVCPGVVRTQMTEAIHEQRASAAGITPEESLTRMAATIPLGRVIGTEELAGTIEFLLSDAAAYITGQALNVCGGLEFN
jgi:NAD(P)-dependent dehydrogenase (short-subunit alcohol dehydrogenase family)